jgi:hypothetical protein
MKYLVVAFLAALPAVSAQSPLWGQCKLIESKVVT